MIELLQPVVTGLGYELVGIEWAADTRGQRILRVYIDVEGGVTVDDCEQVSQQISALLDVEDPIPGHYVLEVSSPGVDRPLFTLDHYRRFRGEEARVLLARPQDGQRRFRGVIEGVEDDRIRLKTRQGTVSLPFDEIEKARLVPDYQAIMKGQRR
ncbi:ribosome maturation factor RimP [Methylomarinovum caldicuralii]|uniref:Ribosome maturation factor RimP n=1 Tax=Methylomarinovum caldicuralii TaxID=438856 RepID=A0AAU9CV78_9GAMM|nr:ribosome maturation factor RimP [Methylomarinovum caldicuralii]